MATRGSVAGLEVARIDPEELKSRMERGDKFTILDVRGEAPWNESHEKIPGGIRVDPYHFRIDPQWPKNRPVVLYCT